MRSWARTAATSAGLAPGATILPCEAHAAANIATSTALRSLIFTTMVPCRMICQRWSRDVGRPMHMTNTLAVPLRRGHGGHGSAQFRHIDTIVVPLVDYG